LEIPNR